MINNQQCKEITLASHPHLNAEVTSVDVVTEEEVTRVVGRPSHLEKLHEVKELPMDIATYLKI